MEYVTDIVTGLSWTTWAKLGLALVPPLYGSCSWSFALKLAFVFWVIETIVVVTYRLTYHPLAKYPGPFFGRITNLYGAWHSFKGDLHLCMHAAHVKYGDVVRFMPNKVLHNTNTGSRTIYQSAKVKKSNDYLVIIPTKGAYSVHTSIDKGMHARKQKVLMQGLKQESLNAFEPTMLHHVSKFCNIMLQDEGRSAKEWTSPKDVSHYCDYLALDIMGSFGFGQDFRMLDQGEYRFLATAISASNFRTGIYISTPYLSKFKLERLFYPRGYRMRQEFLNLTRRLALERAKLGKDGKKGDLFSHLIGVKDDAGREFPEHELWSEAKFLIVAGSDTSSTVLTSLFFYLARNKRCYEIVEREVRTAFSDPSQIHFSAVKESCPYLQACVKEAMRISPPAGGSMWRESEGLVVDGEYMPAGYDIGTSIYALHHKEEYFPRPFEYIPERWIKPAGEVNPDFDFVTEDSIDKAHSAFHTFSVGSRACIGRMMAYMEISNTFARIFLTMEFRKPDGPLGKVGEGRIGMGMGRERESEFQLEDHLTGTREGPFIQFRQR
ncbi:benzoate 4-monooxygenase cytochrome-like protein P450 [Periconia macrospinosa]|uniref:Benzoate 4-monooxygenase cytochrome-like protein P450 n=1 Tax=Periconia macrospinosa TaxID=97972 RepID=A0A2V1E5C0_9PLEO|nr:benzoate 4-monooxygenase cytochrome-like protein P450 [Periconia macrospinosa]